MNTNKYIREQFDVVMQGRIQSMDWYEYLEIPGASETVQWDGDVAEVPCDTVAEYCRTNAAVQRLVRRHLEPQITRQLTYETMEDPDNARDHRARRPHHQSSVYAGHAQG